MPKTEKTYPDWVQKYRIRGTTVKKKGEKYYLYKHLIYMGGNKIISRISDEQREILERFHIHLEVD